ncbi:L-threonylcarbamoyladenylate synthase [Wenyingzhuangia marina]|uniref:tRNA threonylcarbamoyl adenosine modification protein, Sua5/YciO/YrdC/YwlC family n=1 Tax=Wenyingzhuangia marina TaxID=1195760 RepID=A0A1M5W7J8_9FLAO|nr:L-threonylcarbamoyladenylate synthase [Wenyingzhuangia marina]GGF75312.1 threonylcarbamoyl-AMP synthase [Wenyingzhuangia marina]SHH83408.1 tRNA threonylcarbamoyl adenosine modification protein, Sua5/YciO/YrdC/YwlC family [Wenyingzhuangia marina]
MAKLVRIYPENPNEKEILKIVEVLKNGGVIIYPSDTVYALGCDITNYKAMERVAKIKNIKLEKNTFSIVCNDLSHLSDYVKPIDTSTFKILKRAFPGPYTFVLPAINNMPKAFKKRKTVGIRVPDNSITRRIIELLGNPLVSSSIYDEDEVIEYTTDPELIHEKWDDIVDVVIDGGYGDNVASTVIDLSEGEPIVLREGKGSLDIL